MFIYKKDTIKKNINLTMFSYLTFTLVGKRPIYKRFKDNAFLCYDSNSWVNSKINQKKVEFKLSYTFHSAAQPRTLNMEIIQKLLLDMSRRNLKNYSFLDTSIANNNNRIVGTSYAGCDPNQQHGKAANYGIAANNGFRTDNSNPEKNIDSFFKKTNNIAGTNFIGYVKAGRYRTETLKSLQMDIQKYGFAGKFFYSNPYMQTYKTYNLFQSIIVSFWLGSKSVSVPSEPLYLYLKQKNGSAGKRDMAVKALSKDKPGGLIFGQGLVSYYGFLYTKKHKKFKTNNKTFLYGKDSYWLLPLIGLFTVVVPKVAYTARIPSMPLFVVTPDKKEKQILTRKESVLIGQTNNLILGKTTTEKNIFFYKPEALAVSAFNQLYKVFVGSIIDFKTFMLNSNGLEYKKNWLLDYMFLCNKNIYSKETSSQTGKDFAVFINKPRFLTHNTTTHDLRLTGYSANRGPAINFAFKTILWRSPNSFNIERSKVKHKAVLTSYKDVLTFLNRPEAYFIYKLYLNTLQKTYPEANGSAGFIIDKKTLHTNYLGTSFLRSTDYCVSRELIIPLLSLKQSRVTNFNQIAGGLYVKSICGVQKILQDGLDVFLQSKQYKALPFFTENKLSVYKKAKAFLYPEKDMLDVKGYFLDPSYGLDILKNRFLYGPMGPIYKKYGFAGKFFYSRSYLNSNLHSIAEGYSNYLFTRNAEQKTVAPIVNKAIAGSHFIKLHNTAILTAAHTSFSDDINSLRSKLNVKSHFWSKQYQTQSYLLDRSPTSKKELLNMQPSKQIHSNFVNLITLLNKNNITAYKNTAKPYFYKPESHVKGELSLKSIEKNHYAESFLYTPQSSSPEANYIKSFLAALRKKLNYFVKLNNYNTIQILSNYLPKKTTSLLFKYGSTKDTANTTLNYSQDNKTIIQKNSSIYTPFILQNSIPIVLQNKKFFILKPSLFLAPLKTTNNLRLSSLQKPYYQKNKAFLNTEAKQAAQRDAKRDYGLDKLQELNKYKKDMQKKRKAKKQRLEARRKTKRRRFYPRPNWLRLRLGLSLYKTKIASGYINQNKKPFGLLPINQKPLYKKLLKGILVTNQSSVKVKYTKKPVNLFQMPLLKRYKKTKAFLYSSYLNNYIQTLAKVNFFGSKREALNNFKALNNFSANKNKATQLNTYNIAGNITTYNTLLYNLWLASKKAKQTTSSSVETKHNLLQINKKPSFFSLVNSNPILAGIYNLRVAVKNKTPINLMLGKTSKQSLINFKNTASYANFQEKSNTAQPENIPKKESISKPAEPFFWIWLYNLASTNQINKQIYINNILKYLSIPIISLPNKITFKQNGPFQNTDLSSNQVPHEELDIELYKNKTSPPGYQYKVDAIRKRFGSKSRELSQQFLYGLFSRQKNENLSLNTEKNFNRVKWSLNKTNLWASTNQRVNFWSTQKLRRQSKNNKTKYIEKQFQKYLTSLFTNLKLQNYLNASVKKNNIATVNAKACVFVSAKQKHIYQKPYMVFDIESLYLLKNHKLAITQKMHQKQIKLSYITSKNTMYGLYNPVYLNKTTSTKGFLTKPEFFWFDNTTFRSLMQSPQAQERKQNNIFTGQSEIVNPKKNCFTSEIQNLYTNKALSEQQILNTQTVDSYWPITVFALLLHFSALISLISISQIRCFIKFHFILIYKLYSVVGNFYLPALRAFQQIYKNLKVLTKLMLAEQPTFGPAKKEFFYNHIKKTDKSHSYLKKLKLLNIGAFSDKRINLLKATPTNTMQQNKSFTTWFKYLAYGHRQSRNKNWTGTQKQTKLYKIGLTFQKKIDGFKMLTGSVSRATLIGNNSKKMAVNKLKASYNTPVFLNIPTQLFGINRPLGVFDSGFEHSYKQKTYQFLAALSNFLITFLLFLITRSGKKQTLLKPFLDTQSGKKNPALLRLNNKKTIVFYFISFLYSCKNINYELISTFKKSTYDTTLKIVDSFEYFLRLIYGFFEKPAEFTMDWIAYAFLVEWSSDLLTFTPENKDKQNWLAFAKITRQVQPLVPILWISGITSKTPAFILSPEATQTISPLSRGWVIPNILGFLFSTVVGQFVSKRLLYLNDMFIEILNRPDTDLINRQKKVTLFWDIWSDILIKAADQYNINIPSLSNIKEEQNLLIDKFLTSTTDVKALKAEEQPGGLIFGQGLVGNFEKSKFETATIMALPQKNKVFNKKFKLLTNRNNFLLNLKPLNKNKLGFKKFMFQNAFISIEALDKQNLIDWQFNPKNTFLYPYNSKKLLNADDLLQGLKQPASLLTYKASQKSLKAPFITEFVTYQSKETDLFLDYHPPKSFKFNLTLSAHKRTGLSIQYYNLVQQPVGLLVCQIYAGIFQKQISKNILVIGSTLKTNTSVEPVDLRIQKTLLVQALAGETEIKIITDNAQRYAVVNRGFAVGIKLLKEVFESLALNTPCLFLLEDIHLIGERRPLLISDHGDSLGDEMSKSTEIAFGAQRNGDAVHEKNQVLYQYNRHGITHYQKPFKGDFSLSIPTNHFAFDLFLKQRNSNLNNASKTPVNPLAYGKNLNTEGSSSKSNQPTNNGNIFKSQNRNDYSSAESFLQQSGKKKLLAPPSTSPFTVLLLKEQKKLKPKKIVKELPWVGLPSEQLALLPRVSYSVRAKVSALAELSFSNMSAKFDMITNLLVIIDSVRGNRGFVVFATTHLPHILDPALRRPGRLDETISIPTLSNLWNRWEFTKVPQPLIYSSNIGFNSLSIFVKKNFIQNYIYGLTGNDFVVGQSPNGTLDYLDFLNLDILPNTSLSKDAAISSYGELTTAQYKKPTVFYKALRKALPDVTKNLKNRSTWTNMAYYKMGRKFIRNWVLLPLYQKISKKGNTFISISPDVKQKNSEMYTNIGNFGLLKTEFYPPLYNNNGHTELGSTLLTDNIEYLSTEIQYKSIYSATHIIKNTLIGLISGKFSELFAFKTMPMLGLYNFGGKSINYRPSGPLKNINKPKSEAAIGLINTFKYKQKTTYGRFSTLLENKYPLCETKRTAGGLYSITLYGIDQTWRAAMTLAISFVQKRYLYAKNLIVPKLLNFLDYSSLEEAPSPPSSNILIPAKRYESYKKVLKENIELNLYNNPTFGGSKQVLSTKLQKHLKQSYIQSIYRKSDRPIFKNNAVKEQNIKPDFKSNSQIGKNAKKLQNYSFLETIPSQYGVGSFIQPSNISWYYENKLLKRHKNYLTNQWWNGQLIEHNAETLFLSDIDWRYTFYYLNPSGQTSLGLKNKVFSSTGLKTLPILENKNLQNSVTGRTPKDILLDFPDSDQHYNPKHRRWILNSGYWSSWFDFDRKIQTDILNHFIFECFMTSYTILNRNRELLDYSATKYIQKGLIKEINMIGLISRLGYGTLA